MITNKQKQRDFEYSADYQAKSPYTSQQWANLLGSEQLSDDVKALLSDIYASFNHAANVLQISFGRHITQEALLATLNEAGQKLGEANSLKAEVDFDGNEYWWYLFFWGRNTEEKLLELKLHPELAEAIGTLHPDMEEAYYAFASEVERSLQIRYSQEDAVWVAASVLLYEKYYRYPGISTDDILLMQYELQTRAQKIFGQDVNANTISQYCNADERGHRFNYLRDIYKYYRVTFPGELDGDRERPDPEEFDYSAYVYSIFGYLRIEQLSDFLEHEYRQLVDESLAELENASGFVRMATFLTRNGGKALAPDDTSEQAKQKRANGADALETFHLLAAALQEEFPGFTFARKADWYLEEEGVIAPFFKDCLAIETYQSFHAFIGIETITDGDDLHLETSLNLPFIEEEEVMADIRDKCDKLTLMTTAAFVVDTVPAEKTDLAPEGRKVKASVRYPYKDYMGLSEEDVVDLLRASLTVFASYYIDICQNYYPAPEGPDPLKEALGSRLVYRAATEVPGPDIVYKEAASNSTTDFVTKALQSWQDPGTAGSGNMPDPRTDTGRPETTAAAFSDAGSSRPQSASGSDTGSGDSLSAQTSDAHPGAPGSGGGEADDAGLEESYVPPIPKRVLSEDDELPIRKGGIASGAGHPDRRDLMFRLYPKNTLIKGPVKTGKFHEAILTAVGIIEGKDRGTLLLDPIPDILEHYKSYEQEGRILHLSRPDFNGKGYDALIEDSAGRPGILQSFAASCGEGRYVVLMEDVDGSWEHLFGDVSVLLRENRREGASSETVITLSRSKRPFRLPANLFIVATCDSLACEDTILGAIDLDFFISPVSPDPAVLHSMRVEGISLERLMRTINRRISYFLGPDYQLGEGFYLETPCKDPFQSLGRVFRQQIIPILEKWFDQDVERIRYVLGDNAKSRFDAMFYLATPFTEGLFRGEIPEAFDRDRLIYQLNEEAFSNPRSYQQVYE